MRRKKKVLVNTPFPLTVFPKYLIHYKITRPKNNDKKNL